MNALLEVEFAACLLTVGPPEFIGSTHDRQQIPVSTIKYRQECLVWWRKNVCVRPSLHHNAFWAKEYENWWGQYKVWLVENKQ